ncbi:MAG: adenosylhomocysteinase [Chloroflexi bacterium]|nr:adenosylhomocysteinase [Chloroflexota bacterium]|tara:strand:- start:2176 stop:3426 length:1251 start_codon:yes stop_codon:yes gene_type:complete
MKYDIKDINLAEQGRKKAEWASKEMPVLKLIKERFLKEKPLKDVKISGCLHVTSETANLALTLKSGGAKFSLCASNPLSTQNDIAAYLVSENIPVFAIHGEDKKTYYNHINSVVEEKPNITIDDGADLVAYLHQEKPELMSEIIGGMEETTTGVIRLKALAKEKKLKYPIIAANDSQTKHMFDNRYGTGQSTLDGIIRATNILLSGKNFVIIGYGWCGRGLAQRAKGMGAQTIVCEIDPIKALEAVMDGHQVMKMEEASKIGDILVTVTGGLHAINKKHLENLKDGAIIANSGHFNVEIDIESLEKMSETKKTVRPFVEEYSLENGKKICLLGEGRLINLAAAEGHPASVMDMSFANQALGCEFLYKNQSLDLNVHVLSSEIDKQIASLKLEGMKMNYDVLTEVQKKYLNSWDMGT